MDAKTQLLKLLECASVEEQKLIQSLSEKERSVAGTLEQWSAKDMIAHIAAWKEEMVRRLTDKNISSLPNDMEEIDKINAEIFEEHRHQSWDEILDLSKQAYQSLVKHTQSLDDCSNTQAFPWQGGSPLWRWIVGNGYIHPIMHFAQFYIGRGDIRSAVKIQKQTTVMLKPFDEGPAWQGVVQYNLACVYTQAGEKQKAISGLRQAFKLNPGLMEYSKSDPDLAAIREEPAFQALLESK